MKRLSTHPYCNFSGRSWRHTARERKREHLREGSIMGKHGFPFCLRSNRFFLRFAHELELHPTTKAEGLCSLVVVATTALVPSAWHMWRATHVVCDGAREKAAGSSGRSDLKVTSRHKNRACLTCHILTHQLVFFFLDQDIGSLSW